MEKIPTLLEELERKTLELLEKEYTRYEAGELSSHDISIVGKTVWGLVAGLVSADVCNVCESAANEAADRPLYRTFVGNGKAYSIQYRPRGNAVVLVKLDAATMEKKSATHTVAIDGMDEYLRKLTQKLIDADFIELP